MRLLLVVFLAAVVLRPLAFLLLVFFFELRVALLAVFFLDLDLGLEADFFLVTFFRASFRLPFDLPALAACLLVFFFDFFFDVFFDFLLDFLLVFLLVFLPAFLVGFLLDRAAVRLREGFFADFLDARFFDVAFLVGMRVDPGWLQMQPAIIHRRSARGSPLESQLSRPRFQGRASGGAGSNAGSRCSVTTVV